MDILVNNAGITRDNLLMRMKDEEWGTILSKPTFHLFSVCQAANARYDESVMVRIITIGSAVRTMGNGGQANDAAKAGSSASVNHWRAKLCHAVLLVNVVALVFIETGHDTCAER
ncbi:SDR family NAD(P)-dependent oxidoreductase [Escherichia coli]